MEQISHMRQYEPLRTPQSEHVDLAASIEGGHIQKRNDQCKLVTTSIPYLHSFARAHS